MNYTSTAFGINLGYTVIAVLLIYGSSRFLNWHNGVKFSEHVLGQVHGDAMASAVYYGLRWLGVCYVAAALLR